MDVKNDQAIFKSNLGEIKKGNNKKRSREQKNALFNIEMLYKEMRPLNVMMIIL